MTPEEFKGRTRAFAMAVARALKRIPDHWMYRTLAQQLLRSAFSVASNYRAACCAGTRRQFIHKLSIVEEEADESLFWIDALIELAPTGSLNWSPLRREAEEILRMTVTSIRTARARSPLG